MIDTTTVLGANIPNDRFVEIAVAAVVLVGLIAFLRFTRFGLIIRAGVENRAMVTALGIDVRRAFTIVFALGGALAALAGVLSGVYFGVVDPGRGTSLLIFAFIVVVIGGFGSIGGSAVAAVAVGLIQQYANYYALDAGTGDLAVVLLLASGAPDPARAASPRRWRIEARRVVIAMRPGCRARACSRSCRSSRSSIPRDLHRPARQPRHAPAARALPRLRRGRADLRPPLRLHRACSRSGTRSTSRVGVYMTAIALTKWEWGLWPTLAFVARGRRSPLPLVLGRGQPARRRGSRSRW